MKREGRISDLEVHVFQPKPVSALGFRDVQASKSLAESVLSVTSANPQQVPSKLGNFMLDPNFSNIEGGPRMIGAEESN